MTDPVTTVTTALGVTLKTAIAAAAGALVSLGWRREIGWRAAFFAWLAGFFAAIYLTDFAAAAIDRLTGLGRGNDHAVAFLMGAIGMEIIAGLLALAQSARENPRGFIDWWRGRPP